MKTSSTRRRKGLGREETGKGRAAPTNPKSQGPILKGLDNGHMINKAFEEGKTNKHQGEPQGEEVIEGEKDSHDRRPTRTKYPEALRRARTTRWSDEATERPSYQEASIWEKQAWEGVSTSYYDANKTPKIGKWVGSYPNCNMDHIDGTYPETENPHIGSRPPEVIRETQPLPKIINQGRMYKDIMASIGLECPNISMDFRREEATVAYKQLRP
jgi:hypothetical protein